MSILASLGFLQYGRCFHSCQATAGVVVSCFARPALCEANGTQGKKEDPLAGTTYYVGPHYEVLVPAVFPPPAPADLTACYESMGGPNVCNDLAWTGSSGVTYNVYRNSSSLVPIDAGHRIASGLTESEYTDCGTSPLANCLAVWRSQTARGPGFNPCTQGRRAGLRRR